MPHEITFPDTPRPFWVFGRDCVAFPAIVDGKTIKCLVSMELLMERFGLPPREAGNGDAELPQMSASATIQPDGDGKWTILENGEARATYPSHAIRFSVLWKAAVQDRESRADNLTLDRIMAIFIADLRHRNVVFQMPSDPSADAAWILLLQWIYADPTDFSRKHEAHSGLTLARPPQL